MPYSSDKIKIEHTQYDRRIKLTQEDKAKILRIRQEEGTGYGTLAKMFSVSKRTIQFICDPAKLARNIELRNARGGWARYYNKDEWAKAQKEHRQYKHKLKEDKKIFVSGTNNKNHES
jgi:hypothetical protein